MVSQLLDREDLARIDAVLQRGKDLAPEFERMKLAGIDVSEKEADFQKNVAKMLRIREAFFPND